MPDGFGEEWTELDNFFGDSGRIDEDDEVLNTKTIEI